MKKIFTLFGACAVALSMNAQTPDAKAEKVTVAPVIDGVADALWKDIPSNDITAFDAGHPATIDQATFKLAWSDTALYILLDVLDDQVSSPMQWGAGINDGWKFDRAEVYISGNPASVATNWGAQYSSFKGAIVPGGTKYSGTYQIYNRMPFGGDTSLLKGSETEMLLNYQATKKTADRYTIEWAVPWSNLKDSNEVAFKVAKNAKFRFDIYLCDRDLGVDDINADRRWLYWKNAAGNNWDKMANNGVVELVDENTTKVASTSVSSFSIIPNPAVDVVKVQNISFDQADVYTITGQKVLSVKNVDNTINVGLLKSGVYSLTLRKGNAIVGQSKLLKK